MKKLVLTAVALITALLFSVLALFLGESFKKDSLVAATESELTRLGDESLSILERLAPENYELEIRQTPSGLTKVKFGGEEYTIKLSSPSPEEPLIEDKRPLPEELESTVESSKNYLKNFIEYSSVLEEKNALKAFIGELSFQMGEFAGAAQGAPALYHFKDATMYINTANVKYVCEWMLSHELMHALADKTNSSPQRYAANLYTEGLTDLLVSLWEPQLAAGIESGYQSLFPYVYALCGIVGTTEVLEAYFYGYDNLWEVIPPEEFNLFISALDQLESDPAASTIALQCLQHWKHELG